jgi:hypothetical protein
VETVAVDDVEFVAVEVEIEFVAVELVGLLDSDEDLSFFNEMMSNAETVRSG